MIFELDNVELNISRRNILKGIYLKAEIGKITGILGSNGCGKSCLLQVFFGSMKAKYKLVRVDNTAILKPLYTTKKVKYLPQFNFIPKNFKLGTIFDLYQVDWKEFKDYFPKLTAQKTTRFKELSGGERRLVETYLILKSKSDLILMDEPFSHLAPLNIEVVKQIISEEKRNKAIVITDHMYNHIIDTCDNIYLLKNGSTKKINDLEELETYKYLSEGSFIHTTST